MARRVVSLPVVGAAAPSTSPSVAVAGSASVAAFATVDGEPQAATSRSMLPLAIERPRTWGDCVRAGWGDGRPCPWLSCRHHVLLEVRKSKARGDGIRLYGERSKGGPRLWRPHTNAGERALLERAVSTWSRSTFTCSLRARPMTNVELGRRLVITKDGARQALRESMQAAIDAGARMGMTRQEVARGLLELMWLSQRERSGSAP